MLTVAIWLYAHHRTVQIGRVVIDVDPYGTMHEYRAGVFFGGGRVALSRGVVVNFPFEGTRKPASHGKDSGVFVGDFRIWDGFYEQFPLRFGYASIDSMTTVGWPATVGPFQILGTHVAVWIGAFAAMPCWWWVARRHRLPDGTIIWVPLTYIAMALFTAVAVVMPVLAKLILVSAVIMLLSRCGRLWWEQRSRAGRCRVCGYDVRATPDPAGPLLERCPECGTYTRPLRH
jgi:hypothetical protein